MKTFLKHFFFFFIPLILFLLAIEIALRGVPNEYKYKAEWMEQHARDVEVLTLGSSHSFYGIIPHELNNHAFSLAFSAQGLDYDCFLLKKYASQYKKLKTVIVTISYFTLFDQGLIAADGGGWRAANYKIYFDSPFLSDYSPSNLFLTNSKVYREKLTKFILRRKDYGCGEDGGGWYKKVQIVPDLSDASSMARVIRHSSKNWKSLEANKGYLISMARFCQEKNVQLVLITAPTWHNYYDNLNPEQLNRMYGAIKDVRSLYPVKYLNYINDKRFIEVDFKDGDHLSPIGAHKFTKILKKDLFG